jgi:hypothetical protein
MSTSKTVVLQKAFLFLTAERLFQKRWVSLLSIESALRLRYPFSNHYDFNKAMLSKSLGKLHPKIDSLQEPNGLGVYRCKMSGGYFFTIQDLMLAPPNMPATYANNSEWSKLCKLDEKFLASYEKKCNQVNTGRITTTDIPKRNRRYYWTTSIFSLQTKNPPTTQESAILLLLKWQKSGQS